MIWLELRKICNKHILLSFILFIFFMIFYNYHMILGYREYVTDEGRVIGGLESYKVQRKEENEMKGNLTIKYMKEIYDKYQGSNQKLFLEKPDINPLSLDSKYVNLNILMNFPDKVKNSSSGDIALDFPKEHLNDYYTRWSRGAEKYAEEVSLYTEQEVEKIKVFYHVKTPFYYEGSIVIILILAFLENGYIWFYVLLIVGLSGVFVKEKTTGLGELELSSEYGKTKLIRNKMLASIIFTTLMYLLFIIFIFGFIYFIMGSFSGLRSQIQTYFYPCPYDLTLLQGLGLLLFSGYLGTLVMSMVILLISISLKHRFGAFSLSMIFLYLSNLVDKVDNIEILSRTRLNMYRLIPLRYIRGDELFQKGIFYFFKGYPIAYFEVIIIFSVSFLVLFWILIVYFGKNYVLR